MAWLESLQAHLRTCPEDAQSWRVYADWLLDQGDARGEIIQLEQRAGLCKQEQRRLRALVAAHQDRWLELDIASGITLEWAHGFVMGARIRGHLDDRVVDTLYAVSEHPTGRLFGSLDLREAFLDGSLSPLIRSGVLSRVTSLTLGRPYGALEGRNMGQLAHGDAFASLTRLDLSQCALNGEDAAVLARATRLQRLTSLSLRDNRVDDRCAQLLVRSDALPALALLDLRGNSLARAALVRPGCEVRL